MNISRKLVLGFGLVTFMAIIVGAIGIVGMQRLRAASLSMYEKHVLGLEYIEKASLAYKNTRIDLRRLMMSCLYDDPKHAENYEKEFSKNAAEFRFWIDKSYGAAKSPELLTLHTRIISLFDENFVPGANQIILESIEDMPDHNNKLRINVLLASLADITEDIDKMVLGIIDMNSALAQGELVDNARITRQYILLQYLFLLVTIVISVAVGYIITKSVYVPIREAANVLNEIANGNFNARVKGNYSGELALIENSVNDAAEKLSTYLNDKLDAERDSAAAEAVISSLSYARKIQKNLLPDRDAFSEAFLDYSVLWKPRDLVGGDIFWLKNFSKGAVLCVCDCTGHGTPGALLTMLVVSSLDAIVTEQNCTDTAKIIYMLDQRIANALIGETNIHSKDNQGILDFSDGCDLAVLYIAHEGEVNISSGNINVFVCDGIDVSRIKGQRLRIGEGLLKSKTEVKVITFDANPERKFYVASDGIFDQIGGARAIPFGYNTVMKIMLENHSDNQSKISEKIWTAFEEYRGSQPRRDDLEMISFKP